MSLSATLCGHAVELFEKEWDNRFHRTRVQVGQINCPLHWLMPEVLRLAQESHEDVSFEHMRPVVRRLVIEFDFANQTAVHDETEELIDAYVDTLVRVVERVRHEAQDQGMWLTNVAPAMPPMVG